jgi:tRNA 2-thiocytidine biosynthesis protein TtcA
MRNPHRHDAFAVICKLAGRAIGHYRMIAAGDRLLVGLSGGKDSLILMHVLTRLQHRAPIRFELHAVTVDMGFSGFHGEQLDAYCRTQGWPYERICFPGKQLLAEKLPEERPCSLCSRLRRGQLHATADRLNCNVIVLGQHLDDLCVSLLMSLCRGGGIKTMGPHVAADGGTKRLIRPLCEVTEQLLREAAGDFRLPEFGACDFLPEIDAGGDRAYLERLLEQLEERFPGIRHNLMRSMTTVQLTHLLDPRYLKLPPAMAGESASNHKVAGAARSGGTCGTGSVPPRSD